MRVFSPALLLVLACLLPACASCPTGAAVRILRPNFDTPQESGACFLAALACNKPDSEYLCLSEDLKRKHGATLDGWILARQDIRADAGVAINRAHTLLAIEERQHPEGIVVWWGFNEKPLLGLLMQQQHYFDIYVDQGNKVGAFLDAAPAQLIEVEGQRLRLALEDSLLRTLGTDPAVTKLVIGSEWKVGGVLAAD